MLQIKYIEKTVFFFCGECSYVWNILAPYSQKIWCIDYNNGIPISKLFVYWRQHNYSVIFRSKSSGLLFFIPPFLVNDPIRILSNLSIKAIQFIYKNWPLWTGRIITERSVGTFYRGLYGQVCLYIEVVLEAGLTVLTEFYSIQNMNY